MSDKAERVAKLIWDGVYGNGHVPPIVAAILREEYPDEPTLDQLAKAQGVEPIEDMGTLVIPGLEDDPPIDPAPDVSALREVSPGVWLTESRHAAECLWRDLPLNDDGTFRSTASSLDTIEKHMVAFLEGHRPDHDVSEAEKALCMDILGERGRSVDEVNRLAGLLITYREGIKAQTAPPSCAPSRRRKAMSEISAELALSIVLTEACSDGICYNHEKACALIRDYGDERANEAYKIGFDNGYARQKYDADWNRVEANL
jgi:hypothetical protein